MTNSVQLSPRDRSLLQLLSWTPATTMLLLQASSTFAGGSFTDERRLRERLQTLERAGFVRHWSTATIGGGLPLIDQHSLHGHLYADDTQTYGSCRPDDVQDFEQRISACDDDVALWMKFNRLQLNTDKTEVLWCIWLSGAGSSACANARRAIATI